MLLTSAKKISIIISMSVYRVGSFKGPGIRTKKKEVAVKRIKKIIPVMVVAAMALCVLVAGCEKPTEAMERAERAIADARSAGAAQEDIASAERALEEGKDLMDNVRYGEAEEKFDLAYSRAVQARREAERMASREMGEPEEPMEPEPMMPSRMYHTVKKGECLWWIAEYKRVYGDPFQWPLIYDANRDEIDRTAHRYGHHKNEEDWIFPDQEFEVPKDVSMDKIKDARKRAGAPAPYLPPGM